LEAAHFQGMLALIDEQLLIDELEPKPKPKGPEIRRDHCQHGRKQSEPVRRMRHGLLPARAPEEPVQGLRYGLLPVRAPEEQVQGLQPVPLLPAQAPAGQVQGLRHRQIGSRQQSNRGAGELGPMGSMPCTPMAISGCCIVWPK
jgi:hypothetical protein